MTRSMSLAALVCAVVLFTGCAGSEAELAELRAEVAALKARVGPPPASLAGLYPPLSEAPVFLLGMHELAMPFAGMISDLQQGDAANAASNFEAFQAKYQEVGGLVPEWTDRYPSEPIDALAAALAAGDPEAVMPPIQGVGAVCLDCHVSSMASVHQLYRWPRFADVRATDPVTQGTVTMAEYMQGMEVAFMGVAADLQQGQLDAARANYDAFSTRFRGLADLCMNCHETERRYFIDEDVLHYVDQLGTAVASDQPNPEQIMGTMMRIGEEACGKCHLVHTAAAFTQARWMGAH